MADLICFVLTGAWNIDYPSIRHNLFVGRSRGLKILTWAILSFCRLLFEVIWRWLSTHVSWAARQGPPALVCFISLCFLNTSILLVPVCALSVLCPPDTPCFFTSLPRGKLQEFISRDLVSFARSCIIRCVSGCHSHCVPRTVSGTPHVLVKWHLMINIQILPKHQSPSIEKDNSITMHSAQFSGCQQHTQCCAPVFALAAMLLVVLSSKPHVSFMVRMSFLQLLMSENIRSQ